MWDSQKKLVEALPPAIGQVQELERICELEQPLFDKAWEALEQVLAEQFTDSCSEYGMARREAMLGIVPEQEAGADERIAAILFRLNEQLPFTLRKLDVLLGLVDTAKGYSLSLNYDKRELDVWLSLRCKSPGRLIEEVLERTVPANIKWVLQWIYNKHGVLASYSHSELSKMTHGEIREEVMEL